MAQDPVEVFRQTVRVRREELPAVVDRLAPDEVVRLTEVLESALERRHDEIETAIDEGLRMVPRPLRGPVKKIVGV